MGIFVLVGDERRGVVDFDSEFFVQLANQRLARLLARFALTTGKFPTASHVLARGTLCNQHATRGVEQGAGDDVDQAFLSFCRQSAVAVLVLLA